MREVRTSGVKFIKGAGGWKKETEEQRFYFNPSYKIKRETHRHSQMCAKIILNTFRASFWSVSALLFTPGSIHDLKVVTRLKECVKMHFYTDLKVQMHFI